MNFIEKVAIVTGGASGIGKATVVKLISLGAKVAIVDINYEQALQVKNELEQMGGHAAAIKTDITDFNQAKEMAKKVKNLFGKINVLINNAGWDKIVPFMDMEPTLLNKLIDINLKGAIYCTRAVLEYMIEQGEGGKIVNVASDAGRVGSTGESVYAAAKGGVLAFTKSIAREMARYNILVNCTCPVPTNTPLFNDVETSMPKLIEAVKRAIPLKRIAKPEEQANAIVWLASDEASFVTGQVLSVNGGMNMC